MATNSLLQVWVGGRLMPFHSSPYFLQSSRSSSLLLGSFFLVCSVLAEPSMVSSPSGSCGGRSGGFSSLSGSPAPAPLLSISSGLSVLCSSCMETLLLFARVQGFLRTCSSSGFSDSSFLFSCFVPVLVHEFSSVVSLGSTFYISSFLEQDC